MDEQVMKPMGDLGTTTFAWRPVKGVKGTIEVHTESGVFGTLRQEKGRPTIASTADGRWSIEKSKGTIIVRDGRDDLAATFTSAKGGTGMVRMADEQEFRWAPTHPHQAERAFYDRFGRRVVRFWKDWRFVAVIDKGEADPGMAALSEFPLLVMLGRVIGIGEDDGSFVAIMTVTSSL
jgi:hypothetical protein